MTAFLQQYISPALPVILWLGRALVSGLAVWLLVRCCLSLFRGKDRESWGFVTLSNGARYEIYHWENVIGRAKRSDIRINFPSVSRSHAILSRDEAGTWRVNPLNHSSGVLLNGQRTLTTADLHPGDSIAVGGVELFFFPSDKPQPSGQPGGGRAGGRPVAADIYSAAAVGTVCPELRSGEYLSHQRRLFRIVRPGVGAVRRQPEAAPETV